MTIQHPTPTTPLRARLIADMSVRNLGPASQTGHLRACKRFAAWLGRSPETATPDDVRDFQQHLMESGTSICTRNRTMTGVKFLFRVTLRRHDLVAEVFSLKEPVKVPLVLSRNEVKRILLMAPSLKARVMLSLAYGCGMRAGEVVRLRVGDIDGAQNIIRIVQSKGRKDRNVMLPVDILGLLRDWWKERPTRQDTGMAGPERVIFAGYRGKHLSPRQISRLFKQAARAAGITKPVTLHTLRHSFATHLLERGVDIRVIQALLGHTKLTTTARYASVATGMISAVESSLDELTSTKRKKGKKGASWTALAPSHRCKQRLSGSGAKLEVADIFRAHGAAWRAANAGHINLDQLKVMSAIERCRTAALGGHVTRCEDCAHEHIAYNSCRNCPSHRLRCNRLPGNDCPKCQAGAAKAWLAAREAELLPVRYFHLVFTLPKPIADIALTNKREIYNLLMRLSADTVIRIAADPKHLGARVGITSVLHTWGSAMTHHPHVHMIVPGGGLSADGTKWIACRRNFFLSVRVLSRLYRRLILEGLAKLHFFGDHAELANSKAFGAVLDPLRQLDWVVYAKEPFAGPKAVLAYLSRYTHRIAISNSRLIRFDETSVTFRVKNYRVNGAGRHTTMTLATEEFIRRFLIHVLPKGQHRIRHYGFYGNGNRAANIARIRDLLGSKPPSREDAGDANGGDTDQHPRVLALPCPCCGGRLIIVDTVAPAQHPRAPPTSARAAA